ncbi:head-tail connector protein [Oceanicella actignis]|uniref:Phage gp6-like head-tail connector protein n=1 Tax=Oceanicella actignis TaxID=1189325 RepID=A0A1M7TZX7_9RHOB|nr:head-tail connector protein [Oceanicella actignis]TYO85050.1 putative phiE125 gp8 family phage protein [Oceanicella actignis]SET83438.1 phage conserved hypothetical protein, phiE125 gp8 family [Oceanicella actignis]SHN76197.1 phage conserved hypothetical protein, phiE125 gp8 family [Oceanicella actignis]
MLTELASPPVEALPLAALSDHLRLPSGFAGHEEPGLEGYMRAALATVENMTGKALLTRRFRWRVREWPRGDRATLPVAPVRALASAARIGPDGAASALDLARLALIEDAHAPALTGAGGGLLPGIPCGGAIEVEFDAGYGASWDEVPADLRQAAMMLAAHFHEQRHVAAMSMRAAPMGVQALLAPYRRVRL